jgi:hypothetical protein
MYAKQILIKTNKTKITSITSAFYLHALKLQKPERETSLTNRVFVCTQGPTQLWGDRMSVVRSFSPPYISHEIFGVPA